MMTVTFETVENTWKSNVVGNLKVSDYEQSKSTLLPNRITAITGGRLNFKIFDKFQIFDLKFTFTNMPSMIYKR